MHVCLADSLGTYYRLAETPGIARVNKKIIIFFLYPFSPFIPFPPTPFPLAIPGLHLPSPYFPFLIKVLVGLPIESPIDIEDIGVQNELMLM